MSESSDKEMVPDIHNTELSSSKTEDDNVARNNIINLKLTNSFNALNNNSVPLKIKPGTKKPEIEMLKKKAKDLKLPQIVHKPEEVIEVPIGKTSAEIKLELKKIEKRERSKLWKYRGFVFTLLSSLVFSVTALLVKYLKNYNPINVALWRFQGAFLPAVPLVIFYRCSKNNHKKVKEKDNSEKDASGWLKFKIGALLLTRSILSCNALLLHFYSLKYLELGDALVISSSTPVFAYFFAHYLLGEPCGIVPILTSLTTLLGVVVIIRPPHLTGREEFDVNTLVGSGLALGCTLLATISFVVLRYLRRVHYSITTIVFGSWGTMENLVLALIFGVFSFPRGTEDWILAGALASLTFFGQISIILALKCEQTGPVSLVRTCDVIFGYLWQIIFWKIVPDTYSLVGATIVILGVILTGIRKWLGSLPANNSTRKKFRYLLV